MSRRGNISLAVAGAVLLAAVLVVAAARHPTVAATNDGVPLARVKRGDLDLGVFANGEVHASNSVVLTAPAIGGGNLKITRLVHTGITVKKGDIVIEFDPSEQHYKVEQSRSELLQAEQEIIKAQADAAVQMAKDKVDLLKGRYALRRAELDVQKNELLSTIDARKNELALEQAKRALAQLEQDIKSHSVSSQASISLAQEKHNKAKLAMDQARQNIEKMRVTSPLDGLIALEKNRASSMFFFSGMALPEFRVGDQVEPGSAIAQVVNPKQMELVAKVSEFERSNVSEGQSVDIELDALPGHVVHGIVKNVGGISARRFWDDSNSGGFDIAIEIVGADVRIRPGLTAHALITGDKRRNVLYVPRQALFVRDGKRVLYTRNGGGFEAHEIKIQGENESRAAVEGLSEGTEVALADPTVPRKSSKHIPAAVSGGTP